MLCTLVKVGGRHPLGTVWAPAAHREELSGTVLAAHAALRAAALAGSPGLSQHGAGASGEGKAKLTIRKLDFGMSSFSLEVLKCLQCHVQGELQLDKKDIAFELKVFVTVQ